MDKHAGCQINLDKGCGQIEYAKLIDDIRCPCSEIQITFESPEKLTFTTDDQCYFTYGKNDWCPASYSESKTQNGTWHYDITGFPKPFFKRIDRVATNTKMLASAMGLTLSDSSKSLELKTPIIGLNASELINKYREYSLNENYLKGDMGGSMFIYFNSKTFSSTTLKTIVSETALSLEDEPSLQGANIVKHIDDQIECNLLSSLGCEPWTGADYIRKILGEKFEITTSSPAYFGHMYTIKFEDTSEFDSSKPYLCIRSEYNTVDGTGYVNTFAEVKYVR